MYLFKSLKWIVDDQGSLLDENKNDLHSENVTYVQKLQWLVLQRRRAENTRFSFPSSNILWELYHNGTSVYLVNGRGVHIFYDYITNTHS